MPTPGEPIPRRAALRVLSVAAVGPFVVAGCSTETTNSSPPPDADLPAAGEATALTRGAIASITATIARHPDLTTRLQPVLAMHRTHLRRLRSVHSGTTVAAAPVKVPAAPQRALARVRTTDATRATRLEALAGAAHSGGFARMLASMAAAIDQRSQEPA